MKYMKLFEAFESDTMTETIKFLTKKIGKLHSQRFKEIIKRIEANLNVPIDKISDDDVLYTTKNKAVKITIGITVFPSVLLVELLLCDILFVYKVYNSQFNSEYCFFK